MKKILSILFTFSVLFANAQNGVVYDVMTRYAKWAKVYNVDSVNSIVGNLIRHGGNAQGQLLVIGTKDNNGIGFIINNNYYATLTGAGFNIDQGILNTPGIDVNAGNNATTNWYNTVDKTTNWARVRGYYSGNTFNLIAEKAGTGVLPTISLNSATSLIFSGNGTTMTFGAASLSGMVNINRSISTGGNSIFGIIGKYTNSSLVANVSSNLYTINQTGTAGYRANLTSIYEQSTGSGVKLLMDLGTNSAANGAGTHTSRFTVSNTGRLFVGDTPEYADNAAAKAAGLIVGTVYRTGDILKIVR